MEIKEYREYVKALAKRRDGEVVFNGSPDHASALVEQLFASANHSVHLLTGDLNAKVYGRQGVVDRAKQFLGHSDRTLKILVEDLTFSDAHPLIEALRGTSATIYHVPREVSTTVPYHFMTADNDCYRFEREKDSHAAIGAFGDVDTASHLNSVFSVLLSHSVEIDIGAYAAENVAD